jgi:hypothetical protein
MWVCAQCGRRLCEPCAIVAGRDYRCEPCAAVFRRRRMLGSAAFGAIGVGALVGLILLILHFGTGKPKAHAAPILDGKGIRIEAR